VLVNYINQEISVDPSTGLILETAARDIDSNVDRAVFNACVATGDASGVASDVDRTNDIQSTGILIDSIDIVGNDYARQITVNIGFVVQLSNAA
jgi:hypothetical protein